MTRHPKTSRIQDHVRQLGQGRIVVRGGERLTPMDPGLLLIRTIWGTC